MSQPAWPMRVRPEWVDHYGHMNLAFYLVVFDAATDRQWPTLGLGPAFRAQGFGTFAAESWVGYRREVREGEALGVEARVVGADDKRLVCAHRMLRADEPGVTVAEAEFLFLCVDLVSRLVARWPQPVLARLRQASVPGDAGRAGFARRLKHDPPAC